jgi:hypothetical protein
MGRPRKKRKYTKRKIQEAAAAFGFRRTDLNGTLTVNAADLREAIEMARTAARRMEDILFTAAAER